MKPLLLLARMLITGVQLALVADGVSPLRIYAADSHLGVCAHFAQGYPASNIPQIAADGFGWVRDDLTWGDIESVHGSYSLPQWWINWVTIAGQNGLKVDVDMAYGYGAGYTDPYDQAGFAAAAGWLAGQLKNYPQCQAIEIVNEPNNDYAQKEGSGWQSKYAALLSACTASIHAANPSMTVIGLGAQAGDDFTMMAAGAQYDGGTAHPYQPAFSGFPPHPADNLVYEPPYSTFQDFCTGWKQHDTKPRWDTEWGFWGDGNEYPFYEQGLNLARRILLSEGLGVAYSFIYEFADNGSEMFGIQGKSAEAVVKRVALTMAGFSPIGGVYVNPQYSDPNFDFTHFYGFSFAKGDTAIGVAWEGDIYPATSSRMGRLSWTHPNTESVSSLNLVSGASRALASYEWSQWQDQVVVISTPVTSEPVAYIASAAPAPTPTPTPTPTAKNTINGNDVKQKVDGWGAAIAWTGATLTQAQAQMFFSASNGVGLSLIRTRILADGTIPQSELVSAQLAQAQGAKVWATPWSPPAAWKTNNDENNGGYLLPADYQAWANSIAAYAKMMAANGVNLYAVSIQNEPDWTASYASCLWTADNFHSFIPLLRNALNTAGQTAVKIILPEETKWSFDLASSTLADSGTNGLVDILGGHDYSGTIGPVAGGKPVWETEVSSFESFDPSIANGLRWATNIHQFMMAGINAWNYWWLISANSDNEGLTDHSGNPAKRLYTEGNFAKFVRPGWNMVGVTADPALLVSAYKSGASFAIVAINDGTADVPTTFGLNGLSASSVTPWVTSASQSLASQAAVTVTNGQFAYTVPAQSVVTFVNQAAPPPTPVYVDPNYSDPGYQNVSGTYSLTNGGLPSNATVALNGAGTVKARVSWPAPGANQWNTVKANGQVLTEGSQWVPWGSPTVVVILSWPFTSSPTTFTVQ